MTEKKTDMNDMKMQPEEANKPLAKPCEIESLVKAGFDQSAGAILIIDQNGIIQLLNPATEHLFDMPARHMIGKRFGFSVSEKKNQEVDIVRKNKDARVAEMYTIETVVADKIIHVVSLQPPQTALDLGPDRLPGETWPSILAIESHLRGNDHLVPVPPCCKPFADDALTLGSVTRCTVRPLVPL